MNIIQFIKVDCIIFLTEGFIMTHTIMNEQDNERKVWYLIELKGIGMLIAHQLKYPKFMHISQVHIVKH